MGEKIVTSFLESVRNERGFNVGFIGLFQI